jgi:hypothetical protein
MRLFDTERHEPLCDAAWDASLAERALRSIVADAVAAGDARGGSWPSHPLDDDAPNDGTTLYMGAAGVVWALGRLADEGAIPRDGRFRVWALALPARYLGAPDTGTVVPSYFLGEAGVLLTALRAEPRSAWKNRLFDAIERNAENPTLEALWGAPGTMLAAVFAYEMTGDERWRGLYRTNVAALTRRWLRHGGDRYALWTQQLYGRTRRLLGAAHGFAGNAFALLRGLDLLAESERAPLADRAVDTLRNTAAVDEAYANWAPEPESDRFLVQWCHGAPGMITSFRRAPKDPALDSLLAQAGELIWRAGPLRKGASLCHGTAGNGAAFLTLFERTGNAVWLDRARRFAMHAIRQVDAARDEYGRGRYSLWTGDLGVAVYLRQCTTGRGGLPSLDF